MSFRNCCVDAPELCLSRQVVDALKRAGIATVHELMDEFMIRVDGKPFWRRCDPDLEGDAAMHEIGQALVRYFFQDAELVLREFESMLERIENAHA